MTSTPPAPLRHVGPIGALNRRIDASVMYIRVISLSFIVARPTLTHPGLFIVIELERLMLTELCSDLPDRRAGSILFKVCML